MIVLLVEWIALLIGLAMPITPSKTGNDLTLAEWLCDNPTYLQEVWVYFLFANVALGILTAVALVLLRREQRRRSDEG